MPVQIVQVFDSSVTSAVIWVYGPNGNTGPLSMSSTVEAGGSRKRFIGTFNAPMVTATYQFDVIPNSGASASGTFVTDTHGNEVTLADLNQSNAFQGGGGVDPSGPIDPRSPTASSYLDSVNVILASIGEPPVNSIDDDVPNDAALAKTILVEQSREFQNRGWYWNTDRYYTFLKDDDGAINLHSNVLHVDVESANAIQRGTKLYNRLDRSYTFTTNIEADRVVWFLRFDEMPEAARRYITIRAARVFQTRFLGSGQLTQITADDEARAWAQVQQDELRVERPNMLNNAVTQSILSR